METVDQCIVFKLKVSINLNIFYHVNLVSLLKLQKFSFYKFFLIFFFISNIKNLFFIYQQIIYWLHMCCVIFCTRRKRKQKQHTRESKLPSWNDVTVWKNFRLLYILEAIWADYIQHVMSTCFT